MEGRTIIIGDVHGCLVELQALLKKLHVRPMVDRLIFVGDILDRGPDSIGCLRLVQGLGAECLLGNHEEKYLRWHRHESIRKTTGKPNPMTSMTEEKLAVYRQMDDFDFAWLDSLPAYIELGQHAEADWILVHGGFEPSKELWNQNTRKMIRCRWVDSDGDYMKIDMSTVTMKDGTVVLKKPKGGIRWTEAWKRPERVIYGHAVRSLDEPVCEGTTIGIDTGCCFGGRLTAFVMDRQPMRIEIMSGALSYVPGLWPSPSHEVMDITYIVQVQAEKVYAKKMLDAA